MAVSEIDRLPEVPGVYRLHTVDGPVTADCAVDIRQAVRRTLDSDNPDLGIIIGVDYEDHDSLFEAYLSLRFENHLPARSTFLRQNMAYLAIDQSVPGFFRVADFPLDDAVYLGPFSSRFLVHNALDILSASPKQPSKAPDALRELLAPEPILTELEAEYEQLMDDLDFTASEETKYRIETMKRFASEIDFLLATKRIDTQITAGNWQVDVHCGRIARVQRNGEEVFQTSQTTTEYRPNEALSVDLDERLERWMIHRFLRWHSDYPLTALADSTRGELTRS
jgi:excinuclease UvrABC nuclease subunit